MSSEVLANSDVPRIVIISIQYVKSILIESNDIEDHTPVSRSEEVPSLSKQALAFATPFEFAMVSRNGKGHCSWFDVNFNGFQEVEKVRVGGRVHNDEPRIDRHWRTILTLEDLGVGMATKSRVFLKEMDIVIRVFQSPSCSQSCATAANDGDSPSFRHLLVDV